MKRCIAATKVAFLGALTIATAQGASPFDDPAAVMARVAADLKRCESAPANMNTMAQNGCYSDAVEAADKILASAKEAILARLATRSANDPDVAKDNREIARRLEAAQRAWAAFRKSECAFTATDMLGGSGEAASDAACEFRETQARVKRLDKWLKSNPVQR